MVIGCKQKNLLLYGEIAHTSLGDKLMSPMKDKWISCASRYNTPRKYNVLL